jgi:hypothetical protein
MIRYSTGLRDKLNGMKAEVKGAVIGANLTFVDGGGSADTITDSGNRFVTQGFAPGDKLFVKGATTAANDSALTGVVITSVAAGTLTIPTGSVNTGEVGAAGSVVACAKGGSLKDVMKDGKLLVYSGAQCSPDDAPVGTLLITVTVSGGTFVHGAFGNGLEFEDDPTSGVVEKMASETWQGTAVASGTAGWFLFVANPTDALAYSTTLPRISGSIGVSGADLNISSSSIVSGRIYTIDTFIFTLPEYYGA